jgi:hypothetical protein
LTYHFLEDLSGNWIVVIGLDLLSLACPGLGLGSDIVTSFMLVSPCYCYGYLILLVWRIVIGVTRMELVGVIRWFKALSGAMLGACG